MPSLPENIPGPVRLDQSPANAQQKTPTPTTMMIKMVLIEHDGRTTLAVDITDEEETAEVYIPEDFEFVISLTNQSVMLLKGVSCLKPRQVIFIHRDLASRFSLSLHTLCGSWRHKVILHGVTLIHKWWVFEWYVIQCIK